MHIVAQWTAGSAVARPPASCSPCSISSLSVPRHSRMGLLAQPRARRTAVTVLAMPTRRARPNTPRKELQKQSQVEYLKTFYESANRFEDGNVVYELTENSPRVRALQQKDAEQAQLNQELAERINELTTWQQVRQLLLQHAADLNYLNACLIAQKVGTLPQAQAMQVEADGERAAALAAVAALVVQRASWFQATQFAESAAGLAAAGHDDPASWRDFTAAAERKLGSFTFGQLSSILEVLARMGSVPSLNWMERAFRQAAKHIAAATPAQLSDLLWAWGEMGYTPNDRLFMNELKNDLRRRFKHSEFDGQQLVRLMHGVARWAKYEPNERWLLAFAEQVQPYLGSLPAGDVIEVMVSLVTLQYRPPDAWMEDCLQRLSGMYLLLDPGATSALPAATSSTIELDHEDAAAGAATVGLLLSEAQEGPTGRPQQTEGHRGIEQQQDGWDGPVQSNQRDETDSGSAAAGGSDQHWFDSAQSALYGDGASGLPHDELQLLSSLQQESLERQVENEALATRLASSLSASTSAPNSTRRAVATASVRAEQQQQQQQQQPGDGNGNGSGNRELLPSQLALLAWCFCTIGYKPKPAWMQFMEAQLHRQVPNMDIDNTADVLHSLAGMGHTSNPMLASRLLQHSGQLLPSMDPEPLSHTAIAVVHLQLQPDEAWKQSLLDRTIQLMPLCSLQQLGDLLSAVAQLGLQPAPEAMAAAAARAEAALPGAAPPALATLLWALARLGYKPAPQLLHAMLAGLSLKLRFLDTRSFANVAWALSCLRHRPGAKWLAEYLREAAAKAPFMNDQSLVDVLWALASFRAEVDGPWLAHICEVLGQRAVRLGPGNAAVALWALTQLGLQGQDVPQQLLAGLHAAMVAGGDSAGQQRAVGALAGRGKSNRSRSGSDHNALLAPR